MNVYKILPATSWLVLLFFLLFAFPQWYALTYTKLWELKQMRSVGKDSQMTVLHPRDQMSRLVQLKDMLRSQSAKTVFVVFPDKKTLPLSQNPAFVRGFLQNSMPDKTLVISSLPPTDVDTNTFCVMIVDPTQEKLPQNTCTLWSGL
jgi:hypothetical protein